MSSAGDSPTPAGPVARHLHKLLAVAPRAEVARAAGVTWQTIYGITENRWTVCGQSIAERILAVEVTMVAHDNTDDPAWFLLAKCRGVNPDLFFPDRGGDSATAKAVCRGCPVREACLEYALINGEKWGVWGGCSERERRAIRAQRARRRVA